MNNLNFQSIEVEELVASYLNEYPNLGPEAIANLIRWEKASNLHVKTLQKIADRQMLLREIFELRGRIVVTGFRQIA